MKKLVAVLVCLAAVIFAVSAQAETKIILDPNGNILSAPTVGDTIWTRVDGKFIRSVSVIVIDDSLGLLDGVSDKDAVGLLSGKISEYIKTRGEVMTVDNLFFLPMIKKITSSRVSIKYSLDEGLKENDLPPIQKEGRGYSGFIFFVLMPVLFVFAIHFCARWDKYGKKTKPNVGRFAIFCFLTVASLWTRLLSGGLIFFVFMVVSYSSAGILTGKNNFLNLFLNVFLGFLPALTIGSLLMWGVADNPLTLIWQYSLLMFLANVFSFFIVHYGLRWGGVSYWNYRAKLLASGA